MISKHKLTKFNKFVFFHFAFSKNINSQALNKKLQQSFLPLLSSKFHRPTWSQISLPNISHNLRQIKKNLPQNTKIYAVVKANAYGHGDIPIAYQALQSGADSLAVATFDQALKLRDAGFQKQSILVMGYSGWEQAQIAAQKGISVTVYHEEWVDKIQNVNLNGKKVKVHLKIDTGMNRIGIKTVQNFQKILKKIKKSPKIFLEGIFTHFASADETSTQFYHHQSQKFKQFLSSFPTPSQLPEIVHTGNSAASIRFPKQMLSYIRCGISMYGLYPSPATKQQKIIQLKPALSLYSRLVNIKKIKKGQTVSYGQTYTVQQKQGEWIGTIPIGYADGWRRALQGQSVLVQGKRMEIVGRVCMDQTMIKLDREYEIGEKVTLIGKDQNDEITADQVARKLGTINYQVTCMVGPRVPRVYLTQ